MSKLHKWQGEKRLQTQVLPIAKDTVAIRSLDWDRDRFDIEFACAPSLPYVFGSTLCLYGGVIALFGRIPAFWRLCACAAARC